MKVVEVVELGQKRIAIEAGRVARQAHGAVVVRHEGSMLLATVVTAPATPSSSAEDDGDSFVPLTVEYRERMSAAGRIPGGFGKREQRQGDNEILTSRLVDRALRPLFPKGFADEVQVSITVYGADPRSDLESLALVAATAAVAVSPLPLPLVAGLRVARAADRLVCMPSESEREHAAGDLIVSCTLAATADGIVMLEGGAAQCDPDAVVALLSDGHAALAPLLSAFDRLRAAAGRAKLTVAASPLEPNRGRLAVRDGALAGTRADGRAPTALRPIDCEIGYLPTNHGSALFTRGETQALVSVTLGAADEALVHETVLGRKSERFFLHYNFPAFSVGEVKPNRGPGRREIGHGALARRALAPVLPTDLPFTVRVVSDVLESNGSSSMATVSGASLALMDAGVQISRPVAGIAMGLVSDGDRHAILADISGAEDQHGDMDFKVAGTRAGLTAFQLDNKLGALPIARIAEALAAARPGLDAILDRLAETLAEPRATLADGAPQHKQLRIPTHRVATLIGQGGKTIQELQSQTQTRIDVKDDGRVRIHARRAQDLEAAVARVDALTRDLELGAVYQAEVVTLKEYGAFVRIGDHEGLVHISELAPSRVDKVEDVLALGETINVKVIGADKRGRLELSRKAAL